MYSMALVKFLIILTVFLNHSDLSAHCPGIFASTEAPVADPDTKPDKDAPGFEPYREWDPDKDVEEEPLEDPAEPLAPPADPEELPEETPPDESSPAPEPLPEPESPPAVAEPQPQAEPVPAPRRGMRLPKFTVPPIERRAIERRDYYREAPSPVYAPGPICPPCPPCPSWW